MRGLIKGITVVGMTLSLMVSQVYADIAIEPEPEEVLINMLPMVVIAAVLVGCAVAIIVVIRKKMK